MESSNLSIQITRGESGPLLSSARVLVAVKLNAIEHAGRNIRQGLTSAEELEHHQVEMGQVRAVVDQLESVVRSGRGGFLTGGRALVDEIVVSALGAEGQELADSIFALQIGGDLREITTRLRLVRRLVTTLTRVRA